MKKLSVSLAVVLLCMTALVVTSCQKLRRNTSRARVNTLLVTGNYLKPRLLCELAQYRSKQPIILVQNDPDNAEGTARLFYLPGSGSQESEEIAATQFTEFLTFLNPKMVVFVGNEDECYPVDFVYQARNGNFRVLTISSNDWDKNAQLLGEVMRIPRLSRDYRDQLERCSAVTK
ncbi:MAG: hypothetical protein II943_04030 [Victivallales bacterium]|nr:hypothetical protein [Victivallales bacterium]